MSVPRKYQSSGSLNGSAMTSSNKTLLDMTSTAAVRTAVYDFSIGTTGTPADNVVTWQVQRFTTWGSRTVVTPTPLDSGDPASASPSGSAHSIEPTYTTELWRLGVNQRASYRWVAAPGSELICPATAANGVGIAALSPGYTGNAVASGMFSE